MKKLVFASKLLIYLISGFIILMAFDNFSGDHTIWYKIGGFLISISPGVALAVINWLLRKKELILGIIILVSAVSLFILFRFYEDTLEKLLTIATVTLPLLFAGVVLILSNNKYAK